MNLVEQILVNYLAILISLTFHEFAHAFVADRLGDDTPRHYGRLTLNPMVIIRAHPIGALVFPLIGAYNGFLLGWAATPVNPARVDRRYTVRRASFLIAIAGPASNVLLGIASVGFLWAVNQVGMSGGSATTWLVPIAQLGAALILTNVILALFNIIPIPPLDGFTVLRTSLPPRYARVADFLERYSLILFAFLFMYGFRAFALPLRAVYRFVGELAPILHG